MSKSIKTNLIIGGIVGLVLAGAFYVFSNAKAQTPDTYSVSIDIDGNFHGFAWGSDVIGWINFEGVKLSTIPKIEIIIDNFDAASSSILINTFTNLSWGTTGADSCTFKKGEATFNVGSTATSGFASSGSLGTTTTFFINCINSTGVKASKSATVVVTTIPRKPIKITPNDSGTEITWEAADALSCLLTYGSNIDLVVDPKGIVDVGEAGIEFTLVCTYGDGTKETGKTISIHPQPPSSCAPIQGNSLVIYVNRNTTWTMTNTMTNIGGKIGPVTWSGTNISTTTTQGVKLNKIYTTIGTKTIIGTATITPGEGEPYTSTCTATTSVKLDTGTGGEI